MHLDYYPLVNYAISDCSLIKSVVAEDMDAQRIEVKLYMEGQVLTGFVSVPYGKRLSDLLNGEAVGQPEIWMNFSSVTEGLSNFLEISGPRALDTVFHSLVGRTPVRVYRQGPFRLFPCTRRDLGVVFQTNCGDLQNPIHIFDVSFHVGHEIVRRIDSPRIQRSS